MNRFVAELQQSLGVSWEPAAVMDAVDVLPSRLAVTELALGAVEAAGGAAALLAEARGAAPPPVTVDGRKVSAAFRSDRVSSLDGRAFEGFADLSGFWAASDGWVRTHANYPHHRDRLLATLGLPATAGRDALAHAIEAWPAGDLAEAVTSAGGICVGVRRPEQWREHPQAQAVGELPLVSVTGIGNAPPRRLGPLPDGPLRPAAGLRVLDLTRVIAGPVATATLALLGCEVLRIDPPGLPELADQHLLTGMGKRSTTLDLAGDGAATFRALLAEADVVVSGYRPGALARLGLSPQSIAAVRPGVVAVSLSAWGDVGPWGDRRGFDSVVQAASGIAVLESPDGGATPGALPAQALDHATGYLLAAAVLVALAGQLRDGGSLHVQAHLARTAHWLLDHPDAESRALPPVDDLLLSRPTASGLLRHPPPAVQLDGGPADWTEVGRPWGADPPWWPSVAGR